ncbi:MAG: alpha/beta fold hydrolase [Deltaproteobacteria bacterium]|nr:alpha/beta fold hydrolase [Deltaproteobacteria bacterium]
MNEILRTPENFFSDLPDFPFEPHYLEDLPGFDGLRMHYLDEGPRDAETVFLCLHGQPTWSYLYRKMLPVFTAAGHRVVAPDFFGFGRSDKPTDESVYTFEFHRASLITFVERLGLSNITLVAQDWGGLLGLTIPMDDAQRYSRLVVMNTSLATGETALPPAFLAWRAWSAKNPDMAIGRLMGRSCPDLSARELAAYDAPFPDIRYKAGVRRFPDLVPDHPDAPGAALSRRAARWWSAQWAGPTLMAIGMEDPVLGPPVMQALRKVIQGCPPPLEIAESGHFVQESGGWLAEEILKAFD